MAEQAKAMAALAATYMQAESGDLLGDSLLPPGLHSRGARGTTALLNWRRAFLERPQAVIAAPAAMIGGAGREALISLRS